MTCAPAKMWPFMAAEEKLVDDNIVKLIVANGVATSKLPKGKIAIGKFWTYCRTAYEAEKAKTPSADTVGDAPIPEADSLNIAAVWFDLHNYVLPDAHLLIANQQGELWRDFNLNPPQLRVSLAEKLRTRSCIGRASGRVLAIEEGKAVRAVEVIADEVDRSIELFVRIRGFLLTLSYVSITNPDWFPLQIAMEVSEQLLRFITDTYE